jgi:ubiquinone/menaquinone biosynthesis C-methylase UbiE
MTPEEKTARNKAVEAEYDRLSEFYDHRWRTYLDATLQFVKEAIDCDTGDRILDVPCGTGELSRRLSVRWPSVRILGLDLSLGMLKQARVKNRNGSLQWLQADVEVLPLDDETFDWVICANSFHYFHSPASALRELYRVLRPGGRLVLVDWCDDYWSCKLCSLWLRWTDPAFHRIYSVRQCKALLEHTGFRVENTQNYRVGWIWGLMRFVCRRP